MGETDTGHNETRNRKKVEAISKYNEAPMLGQLVAKGELPPVEERLPDQPLVVEKISEIGKYGGQLRLYGDSVWNMDLHPGSLGNDTALMPANW